MQRSPATEHILIFDSNPASAENFICQLEHLGFIVAAIPPAINEALSLIDTLMPDAILLSLAAGDEMIGYKLARMIHLAFNIPIIFLVDADKGTQNDTLLNTPPFLLLEKLATPRELELTLELALLRHRMKLQVQSTQQVLIKRINQSQQELASTKSELHHLQQRDELSLLRFSNALDDSADSIYLIDRTDMKFVDVNQTACDRSGFTRQELLKMGPHDIKPLVTRQELEKDFDRIAATPDRYGIIETVHLAKNNGTYPVEVRVRALEANGLPIIVAIARDMTLSREKEQAIRDSEKRFRLIFDKSPIGMTMASPDHTLIEANPALCEMLGYRRDELIGKSLDDITHPDDQLDSMHKAKDLFSGNASSVMMEKKYLRKDGSAMWGRLHSSIVLNQQQNPLFALGMIEDISSEKNATLIREEQEKAQKNALIREVHHRIKNHLQGVIGMMRQHIQRDRESNYIIEKAIAQINVVATIHGLQGKTGDESIELLNMLAAIKQALHPFNPACFDKPIHTSFLSPVFLNRDESVPVALALNELLINAAKHGKGKVDISMFQDDERVIVSIRNDALIAGNPVQPGSGLELAIALLQADGITFHFEHNSDSFLAEISFTPPAIRLTDSASKEKC